MARGSNMPYRNKRIYNNHEEWLSLIFEQANNIDPDVIYKAVNIIEKHYFHRYDARSCTSFKVVE